MTKSICIIHNGDRNVAQSVYDSFDGERLESLVVPIRPGYTITDNINYLASHSAITDLSTADFLNLEEMMLLHKNTHIIKYQTTYEFDSQGVTNVWSGNLTKDVHYFINFTYSCISNEIIDLRNFKYEPLYDPIIFSPGRSGTHALKNHLGLRIEHRHHHQNIDNYDQIMYAKHVYLVVRRNTVEMIASQLISEELGLLTTTKKNLLKNQAIINGWQPFEVTKTMVRSKIRGIIDWLNLAVAIKSFNPNTSFFYYEDLTMPENPRYIKNPYDKKKLITNWSELERWVDEYKEIDQFIKDTVYKHWNLR